jgi:hypothetical protein
MRGAAGAISCAAGWTAWRARLRRRAALLELAAVRAQDLARRDRGGRDAGQLVPLRALAASFSLYSVADVAIGFLLYVPGGAWLSARPLRRRGALASLLPGIYLAVATEWSQLVVRGRTFDVTDILVQAAGVCVGWIVLRRAERLHAMIARARETSPPPPARRLA